MLKSRMSRDYIYCYFRINIHTTVKQWLLFQARGRWMLKSGLWKEENLQNICYCDTFIDRKGEKKIKLQLAFTKNLTRKIKQQFIFVRIIKVSSRGQKHHRKKETSSKNENEKNISFVCVFSERICGILVINCYRSQSLRYIILNSYLFKKF